MRTIEAQKYRKQIHDLVLKAQGNGPFHELGVRAANDLGTGRRDISQNISIQLGNVLENSEQDAVSLCGDKFMTSGSNANW